MVNVELVPGTDDTGADRLRQGWSRYECQNGWYAVKSDRSWRPPTDVYETEQDVVIKVEIAGMREADIEVSFEGRRLTVSGCRKDPGGKIIYQNMEIRYGEFRTEVLVGWSVEQDAIRAEYRDGFLFVALPRQARQHHVPIRDTGQAQ